ncbi:MAG: tRNA A-37 threonylcarbamoyl transferase component Bud32 [Halioglobus sp.]|jgi:tRNA A-37 threonylcarbamoyl transferase component Bud32
MENIQEPPKTIGHYKIIKPIGQGGMGEVYLALDTECTRHVALKRIRIDLKEIKNISSRFLHEAKTTGQLSHPAIIPVYSIVQEKDNLYYTMPYVEGDTLRQILRRTRILEKEGCDPDPIGGSIPSLTRIILQVCEAIAYAHSKGVLHRDIKPENIIVGNYGQVMLLDWGLAQSFNSALKDEIEVEDNDDSAIPPLNQNTFVGKAIGTVAYMSPERAFNKPASVLTDIYALGVILYQVLTLHFPFRRKSIKEFRKKVRDEKYVETAIAAPYRNIPRILSHITKKSLQPDPANRYQTVDALIYDLKTYLEGRSEWFPIADLDVHCKDHWKFQENVLLAEHVAITGTVEVAEWVSMMLSKESFPANAKIDIDIRIGNEGNGIGLLLSVPEATERMDPSMGLCLWFGSDINPSVKLFRSTVEVMHLPDIHLQREKLHRISIEKIDNNLFFTLDNSQRFSYISHLPLIGSHIGLLYRDADFEIDKFQVSVGSQQVRVSCLAVPDAFFNNKDFDLALNEYRHLGLSFPGRDEGREAMFRAGVTLIEKAKGIKDPQEKDNIYQLAWDEFEKLQSTPGAPLAYLGKSLVHKALKDNIEEIKCLEMACRKYHKHPLLPVVHEQIIYRMHDSSRHRRLAAYRFLLLVARHLPHSVSSNDTQKIFSSLSKHWEKLPFIEALSSNDDSHLYFCTLLAFWLSKPYVLLEILDDSLDQEKLSPVSIGNILFCLLETNSLDLVKTAIEELQKNEERRDTLAEVISWIKPCIQCHEEGLKEATKSFFQLNPSNLGVREERALQYLMEFALTNENFDSTQTLYIQAKDLPMSQEAQIRLDSMIIWSYLMQSNWDAASAVLEKYPLELIHQETNILHFLYLCWLQVKEKKELTSVLYSGILDTPFPRSWSLATHYLFGSTTEKNKCLHRTFSWEKKHLYRQLSLFYHCHGDKKEALFYKEMEKQEADNAAE